MRAAYITAYGDNSVVKHGELPDPLPGAGEALIEVRAAGVNPVEIAMRQGLFRAAFPFKFPQVMGYDISGVVICSPDIQGGPCGVCSTTQPAAGSLCPTCRRPRRSPGQEAGITLSRGSGKPPTVALTTVQAFQERARLKSGERVAPIGKFADALTPVQSQILQLLSISTAVYAPGN
jgi:hypothetical protein